MDDDCPGRPLAPGFLVFVGPAAVIGHGLAVERALKCFRAEIGVVDEDDRGLARHVEALVIVPALLGRIDAIADEDQFAILERGLHVLAIADPDPVAGVFEIDRTALGAPNGQRRIILARDLDQRHFLYPTAVVARFESGLLEFLDQIGNGLLLARRTRRAAFEFVRGKPFGHALHRVFGKRSVSHLGHVERVRRGIHPDVAGGQQQRGAGGKQETFHG